ncbi:hypothetical protein U1Q18_052321 [Sarracenia purpurea var. burkii]
MKENEALRSSNEVSRRIYDESLSRESNKNSALNDEIDRTKEYAQEFEVALQKEKDVKDKTLLRNAQVSQLVQLTEQELKQQQIQNEELFKKIASLEEQLENTQLVRANSGVGFGLHTRTYTRSIACPSPAYASSALSGSTVVLAPYLSLPFINNARLIAGPKQTIHIGSVTNATPMMAKAIINPVSLVDGVIVCVGQEFVAQNS